MSGSWPKVRLGAVLRRSEETIQLQPDAEYRELTVKLWGKGVVARGIVSGTSIAAQRRYVARASQFVLSRIDARNGAFGIVPPELDGAVVSNDFPTYDLSTDRLLPVFLSWMCRTASFVEACQRASEGTTNRVRLKEGLFLKIEIPLPPLDEQRRVVARIEDLAAQIAEARFLHDEAEDDLAALLTTAYRRIAEGASVRPLGQVAPLKRRPVTIEFDESYPQIAVRSFGRGTFHKPPLEGSEVTWQKPFLIKDGDIVVSNIKAWEGALAVAGPADDGRVGSHRYLTFVPLPEVSTARFVCFHLLTQDGLHQVGEASPGSADRNRTLNAKTFLKIPIPVPDYRKQLWFDSLYLEVDALKRLHAETASELDALVPTTLDRAFKGEL